VKKKIIFKLGIDERGGVGDGARHLGIVQRASRRSEIGKFMRDEPLEIRCRGLLSCGDAIEVTSDKSQATSRELFETHIDVSFAEVFCAEACCAGMLSHS
jgi:hypothetical protein